MPGEEMEISTDHGPNDFGEDIEIDLDFAAAPADEDLELADYDQGLSYHEFNSDNRDEPMDDGEAEDGLYGIADTDEITYDSVDPITNDVDVEIGGTNYDSWQEADESVVTGMPITEAEVTSIGESGINDGISKPVSVGSNAWSATELPLVDTALDDTATGVDGAGQSPSFIPTEAEGAKANSPAKVFASENFTSVTDTYQDILAVGQDEQEDDAEYREPDGQPAHESNEPVELGHRDGHAGPTIQADPSTKTESASHEPAKGLVAGEGHEGEEDDTNNLNNAGESITNGSTIYPTGSPRHDDATDVEGHLAENEADAEWAEDEFDHEHERDGPKDDPYNEPTQDPAYVGDVEQEETYPESEAKPVEATKDANQVTSDSAGGDEKLDQVPDNQSLVAARHDLFIHYGETDYRLFAKNHEDDPNEYFFKDTSALALSLTEFLSGLRDVISEEVSPLDELVMHVDGLGLEFAESMTPQFLDKYTFGDLLILYDSLVNNDEPGIAPGLYIYLMVRPSCLQRLIALQAQANSGRSLTDVAVYRDATSPVYVSHSTNGDENLVASSPQGSDGDLFYDDQQIDDPESLEYRDDGEYDETHHSVEGDEEVETNEAVESSYSPGAEQPSNSQELEEEESEIDGDNLDDNELAYDSLAGSPSQHGSANQTESGGIGFDQAPPILEIANTSNDGPENNDRNNDDNASHNTSETVALSGEDHDEINYGDDTATDHGEHSANGAIPVSPGKLTVLADDEITWESENEDIATIAKPSEQVSTTPGKRKRTASESLEVASDQKGVKRRQS
ncbi:hypothetical protein BX600DRAFT_515637 [Xylariales sp. PMI_506]|nr:hypothetical protein BX600DRAFT_515637 [Xylariales sp. PMI_506]